MTGRTFFIMRHGQTQWNIEGRQQGQQNSALTDKGIAQAQRLADIAGGFHLDKLFASPLERAARTAQTVGTALGLTPVIDERLKESSFGLCEGLTREEIEARFPGIWAQREQAKWTHCWPEGESYADVDQRIAAFMDDLLTGSKPEAVTGILAHETVNKVLLGRLSGLPHDAIVRLGHPHGFVFRCDEEGAIQHADFSSDSLVWTDGLVYKD